MTTERTDELQRAVDAFKRLRPRPYRVRVELTDGGEKFLAIAADTRRWQKLRDELSKLGWSVLEAMDQRGNLLYRFERDDDDDDELGEDALDGEPRVIALSIKFSKLLLEAQEIALDRHTKGHETLLNGAMRALEVVTKSVESLARTYEMRLRMLDELGGAGGKGDGLKSTDWIVDAMMARMMTADGAAAAAAPAGAEAPPNGKANGTK